MLKLGDKFYVNENGFIIFSRRLAESLVYKYDLSEKVHMLHYKAAIMMTLSQYFVMHDICRLNTLLTRLILQVQVANTGYK